MKKGILLLMAIGLLAFNAIAQQAWKPIDTVYVAGVEKTITPTLSNSFDGSKMYDGVAGFMFNVVNYVDTLTVLIFEGGYQIDNAGTLKYVPIDTLTELIDSKTYSFYQAPPVYQYYRMRAPLVSGDTATLKNILYFEKSSKK